MSTVSKQRMPVGDFLSWAEGREGRWELIDGVPIAMGPERAVHGLTTLRVANALDRAIAAAGCGCHVLPDSVVVHIDAHTSYQPDALVYCGERVSDDTLSVDTPVLVIEVLSPGSATKDFRDKLVGYFRVASIQHYLIIDPDRRLVIHHQRGDDLIQTRIVADGTLSLTPPGLEIEIADLFAPV